MLELKLLATHVCNFHLRKVNALISMRICTCWSMHLLSHLLSRFSCLVVLWAMTYKLAWMFKTKTQIRLYTYTVWCPSESSQHTRSLSARQWNFIRMSLCWRADHGPLLDFKQELRTYAHTRLWTDCTLNRTVDNKTSHLLRGDKWELNYTTTQIFDLIKCR